MDEPTSEPSLDRTTRVLLAVWLVGWGALALATVLVVDPWRAFYASAGVELPWVTHQVLAAGDALRAGWGLLPLSVLLGVLSLPAHVVPGSSSLRQYLALCVAQTALLSVWLWLVLELPLMRHRDVAFSVAQLAGPLTLGLTCFQAVWWAQLCAEASRLPPATLGTEALRALMIAALPALVVAPMTYGVLTELYVSGPEVLLVSPATAAAGTVILVTYGAAFGLRLRRPLESA